MCKECHGLGFILANLGGGVGLQIERCDACMVLKDDSQAAEKCYTMARCWNEHKDSVVEEVRLVCSNTLKWKDK